MRSSGGEGRGIRSKGDDKSASAAGKEPSPSSSSSFEGRSARLNRDRRVVGVEYRLGWYTIGR